jgi:iron complex outermembrane receptor protein
MSVPLFGSVSGRLSGVYWDRAGDVDNTKLQRDEGALRQRAGRLKLRATPGERWTLGLSSQVSDTKVDYAPWQLYDADENALSFARDYDPQVEDDPLNAQASFDRPGFVQRRSDLSRLRADFDAGEVDGLESVVLTAVIGHAAFDLSTLIDIDASPADVIVTDFGVDYRQDSLEMRMAARAASLFGLGGEVDLVVGVFGLRSEMGSHLDTLAGEDLVPFALTPAGLDALGASLPGGIDDLLNLLPPVPGVPIEDELLRGFSQDTDSVAVFGQLDWNVYGNWSVIAGLRWGEDHKQATFDVNTTGLGLVGLVVGAETFNATRERREDDLSPKLGLQYAWTPQINSYVSWTRGYKGGGFNATAETPENLEFEAERAQSWEAGLKSRLLDGTLMLNLALYRSAIDELQVVDFTGFSFQVRNAAEARLQGVEADLRWLSPWPWLEVDAALAVSESRYERYSNAPPTEDQQEAGLDAQDLSGRTLANAPELTASLSPLLSFPLPFGRDLGVQLGVDLSYRGDQYSATDLDPRSFQPGYLLLGGRVIFGRNDGAWSLVLAGRNLTDERALDLVMDHSVYSRTYIAQQIPLRSVSLSVQAQWY